METIGKAILSVIEGGLTASPLPSEKSLIAKPIIRLPETVEECRSLKEWADAQPDGVPPASTSQLARHLEYLAVTLPRQAADDESGEKRTAVYARILGGYSNHALAYMARKACETLNWFPTPKQCLDILETYRPPQTEKDGALALCHRFWQGRFEDWHAAVRDGSADQATIDGAPKQWRMIAMERGLLRLLEDGSFVLRRKIISEASA